MILEDAGLKHLKSELSHLDEVAEKLGFIRWQWEYYRATYDHEIERNNEVYVIRINTRAIEGRLESPTAVLAVEEAYVGKAVFPHGMDYEEEIPKDIMNIVNQKISAFKEALQ